MEFVKNKVQEIWTDQAFVLSQMDVMAGLFWTFLFIRITLSFIVLGLILFLFPLTFIFSGKKVAECKGIY